MITIHKLSTETSGGFSYRRVIRYYDIPELNARLKRMIFYYRGQVSTRYTYLNFYHEGEFTVIEGSTVKEVMQKYNALKQA